MLISFLSQLRPLFESSSVGLEAAPAVSMGNPALTWAGVCGALGLQGRELGGGFPAPRVKLLVLLPGWKSSTQNLKRFF